MRSYIMWFMVIIAAASTFGALFTSCASFSESDRARIESIQTEIVGLVGKVESGELTIEEAKQVAGRLQQELEALKASGHSWSEILFGLLGAFVAGAVGIKSPGGITLVKSLLGSKA